VTASQRRFAAVRWFRPANSVFARGKGEDVTGDMLEAIFDRQAELNARIGYDTRALHERFDARRAGQWLNDYLMAAASELEELRDCTFWKHWCAEAKEGRRFEVHDLQNARVEVIDLLFFWVSMAQCVGLTARDVYDLYLQKLNINHARQEGTYSMTGKDEADNRSVQLARERPAPSEPRPPKAPKAEA
jgi:hypothetical protein